ncbi:hypothetical protein [Leptospira stimsonii]|uniref:DUF4376 domain-containing protein n=1 Tax=Leptospira stimsonii TaxID=2202203 RepID=A0A8B3CPC3_9LEPT|nr:hypothetical protein [Leptospira stimsonii]RHX86050.1 hypothetical protein DLM78_09225 [Leptospira stimsonii]
MNYIIEKESNKVVWINSDPQKLKGKTVWQEFDETLHEVVYALHYNPQVQETFLAPVVDGMAVDFQPKSVYDKKTARERILQNWNDKMDSELETEEKPILDEEGNVLPHQFHTNAGWRLDLDQKKKDCIGRINQICSEKISGGFSSSALGSAHHYPFDRDDQLNLNSSVLTEESLPIRCKDGANQESFKIHTPAQIRKVLNDGCLHRARLLERANRWKAKIAEIGSIEGLQEMDFDSDRI